MRNEGLRVPGLLCFTATLLLIAVLQMHNSYVVTDYPLSASQEFLLMKEADRNNLSNTDAGISSFIYECVIEIPTRGTLEMVCVAL